MLSTQACAGQTVTDWFIVGTEPTRQDDWYQQLRICTTDGGLATPDIPPALTAVKTFVVYPPGYPDNMKDKAFPAPPTQACALFTETVPPTMTITQTVQPDGNVLVTVAATDDEAVREVDFYLDGSTTPTRFTKGPYTFLITGHPNSTHSLLVQAYDYNPANEPASQTVIVTLP